MAIQFSAYVGSTEVTSATQLVTVNRTLHKIGEAPTVGTAQIAVDNLSGGFSPEVNSDFRPNASVTIFGTDTDTSSVYPVFTGFASNFNLNPELANRAVVVQAEDRGRFYSRKVDTAMQINTDIRSVFAEVFDSLGMAAVNSVDTDMVQNVPFTVYSNRNGGNALADLLASGGHRSFISANGTVRVRDRNKILSSDSVNSFSNSFFGFSYNLDANNVKNNIRISAAPRVPSTSVKTLTYLEEKPLIEAGGQAKFFLEYKDFEQSEDNVPATSVANPVSSQDWTFNTASDGGGTDLTSQGSVTTEIFARSALVTARNTSSQAAYLTRIQVRGFPLEKKPVYTAVNEVSSSQALYENQVFQLENDLIPSEVFQNDYAAFLSELFKDPAAALNLGPPKNTYPAMLSLDLSDTIAVTENQTSVDDSFLIIGVNHTINMQQGQEHIVNYALEPIRLGDFLVLDNVNKGVLDVNKLAL